MGQGIEVPFILGGHSFIKQLGSDSLADQDLQIEIVESCLDNGITWFDTTYQPERIALGKALSQLGRRDEATIMAWNFFTDFDPDGDVGGADYYQSYHIDLMLQQLKTDYIDCLVVHGLGDKELNIRQEKLAIVWQQKGYVGQLGTWAPPANAQEAFREGNPYSFMVRPYNITTADAAPVFAACKELDWENYACSPFVRGWELDRLVENALGIYGGSEPETRIKAADIMLRYSMFRPNVDRLIVAMRRPQWVERNIQSYLKGNLNMEEIGWLNTVNAVAARQENSTRPIISMRKIKRPSRDDLN